MRTVLTADLTLYSNPLTGSLANDGLTALTALPSIQTAWERACRSYDLAGHGLTIQQAYGSAAAPWYNGGLRTSEALLGQRDTHSVVIDGGGSVFTVTDSDYCFRTGSIVTAEEAMAVRFTVQNMHFSSPGGGGALGTGGGAINVNGGQIIIGSGVIFGAATLADMNASGPASVILKDPASSYTLYGSKAIHANGQSGGVVVLQSVTAIFYGPTAFATAFATSSRFAQVYLSFSTFTNAGTYATGPKFLVLLGGEVETSHWTNPAWPYVGTLHLAAVNAYLPGNVNGTISAQGGGIVD